MNQPTAKPVRDDELSRLLQEWRVAAALAPGFKSRVWRRVAGDSMPLGARPGGFLRAWIDDLFARRSWSVGYALVLLGAGLVAGYWRAAEQTARWDEVMATRYVQSVDPSFQAAFQP